MASLASASSGGAARVGATGGMDVMLGGAHVVAPGFGASGSHVVNAASTVISGGGSSGGVAAGSAGAAAAAVAGQTLRSAANPLLQSVRQLADDTPAFVARLGQGIVNRGADFGDDVLVAGGRTGGSGGSRLAPLADDYWNSAARQLPLRSASSAGILQTGSRVEVLARSSSVGAAARGVAGARGAAVSAGQTAAGSSVGQAWNKALDAIRVVGPVQGGPAPAGNAFALGSRTAAEATRSTRSIGTVLGSVAKALLLTKRAQMVWLTLGATGVGIGVNIAVADDTEEALMDQVEEAEKVAAEAVTAAMSARASLDIVRELAQNATKAAEDAREEVIRVKETLRNNTLAEEDIRDITRRLVKALTTQGGFSTVSKKPPRGFKPGSAKFLDAQPVRFNGREWILFSFLSPNGVEKAVLIHTETGEIVQDDEPAPEEVDEKLVEARPSSSLPALTWDKMGERVDPIVTTTTTRRPAAGAGTTMAGRPTMGPGNWPVMVFDEDLHVRSRRSAGLDNATTAATTVTTAVTTMATTTTTTLTTPAPTIATASTTTTASTSCHKSALVSMLKKVLDRIEEEEEGEQAVPTATTNTIATTESSVTTVTSVRQQQQQQQRRRMYDSDLWVEEAATRVNRTKRAAVGKDLDSLSDYIKQQKEAGGNVFWQIVRAKLGNKILLAIIARELERPTTVTMAEDPTGRDGLDRDKRAVFLLAPFLPMIMGTIAVAKTAATATAAVSATVALTTTVTGVTVAAVELAPIMAKLTDPSNLPRTTSAPPTEPPPPPPTATPVHKLPPAIFQASSFIADLESFYKIDAIINAVLDEKIPRDGQTDDFVLTDEVLEALTDLTLERAVEVDKEMRRLSAKMREVYDGSRNSLTSGRAKRSLVETLEARDGGCNCAELRALARMLILGQRWWDDFMTNATRMSGRGIFPAPPIRAWPVFSHSPFAK